MFECTSGIFQHEELESELHLLGHDGGLRLEADNLLLRSHGRQRGLETGLRVVWGLMLAKKLANSMTRAS